MFLDPAVIPPSSHAKYRLAITIIHQCFRNGRTDDYNVTEAIQAAVKAVTERFEKVSLRASADDNLGVANDAKRAPADANSSVWISKIAYGTNRRLRDKCDLANGQLNLKF